LPLPPALTARTAGMRQLTEPAKVRPAAHLYALNTTTQYLTYDQKLSSSRLSLLHGTKLDSVKL